MEQLGVWNEMMGQVRKKLKGQGISLVIKNPNGGKYAIPIVKMHYQVKDKYGETKKCRVTLPINPQNGYLFSYMETDTSGDGCALFEICLETALQILNDTAKLLKEPKVVIRSVSDDLNVQLKRRGFMDLNIEKFEKTWNFDCDDNRAEYVLPITRTVISFFESICMENKTVEYKEIFVRAKWFLVEYYYKGHSGKIQIKYENGECTLVDETLSFEEKVRDSSETIVALKTLLDSSVERNKLKNLVEPPNKHFEAYFKKLTGYNLKYQQYGKAIFDFLVNHFEPEIIEAKIVTEAQRKINIGRVWLLEILGYIFVIQQFTSLMEVFPSEEKELSLSLFKGLVMKQAEEQINFAIDGFV